MRRRRVSGSGVRQGFPPRAPGGDGSNIQPRFSRSGSDEDYESVKAGWRGSRASPVAGKRCDACGESSRRRTSLHSLSSVLGTEAADVYSAAFLAFDETDIRKLEENRANGKIANANDAIKCIQSARKKIEILDEEYASLRAKVSTLLENQFMKPARLSEKLFTFADKIDHYDKLLRNEEIAARRARMARDKLKRQLECAKRSEASDANVVEAAKISAEKLRVEESAELLGAIRYKRCRELYEIFPVVPSSDTEGVMGSVGDYRIAWRNSGTADELQAESAAGYALLVRLLSIISVYLDIPLPHPSDASSDYPALFGADGNSYPLCPASPDYETALRLLCKNICHLCLLQGVPPNLVDDDPRMILQNVWQLFHCPSLGRQIHRCLADAEGRVASVHGTPRRTSSVDIKVHRNFDLAATVRMVESMAEMEMPDECEGWSVMNIPRPPRPSQPEDIEHWVRSHRGQNASASSTEQRTSTIAKELFGLLKF